MDDTPTVTAINALRREWFLTSSSYDKPRRLYIGETAYGMLVRELEVFLGQERIENVAEYQGMTIYRVKNDPGHLAVV
jgi:hypothetical protein